LKQKQRRFLCNKKQQKNALYQFSREKEALEEEKLQRAAKFFYVLGACFVFVIVFFAIKAAFVGSAKPVASTY
jgi:hypothetical protein